MIPSLRYWTVRASIFFVNRRARETNPDIQPISRDLEPFRVDSRQSRLTQADTRLRDLAFLAEKT